MTATIWIRNLGSGWTEAYFTADTGPGKPPAPLMAIHHRLPYETQRARVIEGHGYVRRPPKSKRRACVLHTSLNSVDEISVGATRAVIEEHISSAEIEHIKKSYLAAEFGDAYWIEYDTGIHVNIVLAVLRNLHHRGELPKHPSIS